MFFDMQTVATEIADAMPHKLYEKQNRNGLSYGNSISIVIRLCSLVTCAFRRTRIDKILTCNVMRCWRLALMSATCSRIMPLVPRMIGPAWSRHWNSFAPGDVLVVWKLDRLGRSLSHLLSIVTTLKDKQVAFRSLTEGMDTTTASGELLFHVFGALAQYERALIQERVIAGLAAAKRRGRIGGRPAAIVGEKRDAIIAALNGGMSKAAVCRNFGVKRTTLIDTLARIGWPSIQRTGGGQSACGEISTGD